MRRDGEGEDVGVAITPTFVDSAASPRVEAIFGKLIQIQFDDMAGHVTDVLMAISILSQPASTGAAWIFLLFRKHAAYSSDQAVMR